MHSCFLLATLCSGEKTQRGRFTGFLLPLPTAASVFSPTPQSLHLQGGQPFLLWSVDRAAFLLFVSPHWIRWLSRLPGASQPSRVQANPAPLQDLLKGTHTLPQSCLYDGLEGLCHCPRTACSMAWSSLGHSRWKGLGGVGTVSADSEREERWSIYIPMVGSK